ncbi:MULTISPECIES: PstS family phosphate ABC transporter substrate-binding protein [Idiomarina]|jgi:phosphate transport system substrate-binding protein|uniref:Phosphate-binding protein n=2 Tax=Idiomarina baltica TaxID=190892 RepID=A0A348WMP1_9GAMM|nr:MULTISPECIES: phosphate ABC transporter substrate-binding protein PstS family protein [Idiomarina]MAF74940.1 phosphate-binding protein [Idiomarinaceae bacterium]MEC8926014.1 phosphate ABC transporter substrate-binding protein PstS family protein [Pseudomonadota bacterium]EAQ33019.1 ABC-type phosphate transport system, periplasmic component [Idiomarina baltica OS145]KXS36332.1 MAG: phosphate transport system substrate-binding protein [Idiomarina sp. T82-3]HAE90586.1 phosphate ABC transporter|tara:strand:- start:7392 stop:8375 length:984 start_codon:yes stop_codon:yes gene_type:complete
MNKFNKAVKQLLGLSVMMALMSPAHATDDLPKYEKVSGLSGNLSSVGSDTLANMMTFWGEEFKRMYPSVNIQIQAAGSSTAPPALTEGTASFGPMSRAMKSKEIEAFEKRHGYKPTPIRVAIDALAVFVHKDNPVKGLSIAEVDGIFSSTRKCGFPEPITRWGQLGLTGDWASKDLQLYGRNSVSGTYGYFKEAGLCDGDFKANVNEQPGSASVVQSVSTSLNAVGYSGIGYVTSGVRAVPIARGDSHEFVSATRENALAGKYPLARFLYVYVNKHPNQPLSKAEAEFVKMILSQQGQAIVDKDGYIALPRAIVDAELKKLGLHNAE